MKNLIFMCLFGVLSQVNCLTDGKRCTMPQILRGSWFSWEGGLPTQTVIDANSMSNRGFCIDFEHHGADYSFVFKGNADCYHCVKTFPRTLNVFEKYEGPCVSLPNGVDPSVDNVCKGVKEDSQLITLFNENFIPINCRSSLEGVWHFTYQNRFRFTGVCNKPDARIQSCQTAGTQFLITNQKFNISYQQCEGMEGTFTGSVEYSCLGDWFIGKNHYFAVANTKESRKDEKYRCFLKNRDDDLYIGVSITAQCNTLKTPESSPERLKLTPVKSEVVEPGCSLPQNFSGEWVNTANIDADVQISETHINETYYPDKSRYRRTIYVCRERRGTRIMMARLTVDGCQKDYVCFDFMPRHHNVIRYRKGLAVIKDDFSTVCSWVQFPNKEAWKYNFFLAKNPVPVRCPVAGKFNFTQRGEHKFKTRILGGVTLSPRPDIHCKQNISDLSVCDTDQKEMAIDENYCLSVDHLGRPVDIYSDPDYRMKCIGFWKENLKSYLITHDALDPLSKYRCWVYQRADLNRVLMSQAVGAFCNLKQDVTSWNYTEGAAVAIDMTEYERERDQCPMHFDDGSNPWLESENYIKIFDWDFYKSGADQLASISVLMSVSAIIIGRKLIYMLDYIIGKNHYFAVANTKESRKDEKYRCFLKNRDDDLYIGVSITAQCNTLKTPESSPERLKLTPVKSEVVEPGCSLPQNFSGEWVNTANIDADVQISETHINETYYPDKSRYRRTIYVCRERRGTRIMMARLTVDGCQKDYVCFDFMPRHHNVIRYRKGLAVIKDDFSTVCSWVQFPNKEAWKYNFFLAKNPVPVRCPVAGKFNFTQRGEHKFKTRILGGVTLSPRPDIHCKQNISDLSVCDTDQKEMAIDENYCLSVDHLGRPVDIYSDPDYRMKCIGFWKENLKSYLITHDALDPLSKYRCWVYQRADLNRVLMSQAVGAFCNLKQDVTSWNYTEGAAVAIDMTEYERERDQCPMHFDDGSNPWLESENYIKIFDWDFYKSGADQLASISVLMSVSAIIIGRKLIYMLD